LGMPRGKMKQEQEVKQKTKQENKQSTKVDVKVECGEGECEEKIVSDVICGKIFQPCDGQERVLFRAVKERPSACIRIDNHSGCTMKVTIELGKGHKAHKVRETIGPFQQIALIVPSIQRLLIKCFDDGNNEEHKFCRGKFALKLRFEEEEEE
jgi:hypothetical protein